MLRCQTLLTFTITSPEQFLPTEATKTQVPRSPRSRSTPCVRASRARGCGIGMRRIMQSFQCVRRIKPRLDVHTIAGRSVTVSAGRPGRGDHQPAGPPQAGVAAPKGRRSGRGHKPAHPSARALRPIGVPVYLERAVLAPQPGPQSGQVQAAASVLSALTSAPTATCGQKRQKRGQPKDTLG
jgi:hypothetical protein